MALNLGTFQHAALENTIEANLGCSRMWPLPTSENAGQYDISHISCAGNFPCPSCEFRKVACAFHHEPRRTTLTLVSAEEYQPAILFPFKRRNILQLEAQVEILQKQLHSEWVHDSEDVQEAEEPAPDYSGTQSPIETQPTQVEFEDGISALNLRINNADSPDSVCVGDNFVLRLFYIRINGGTDEHIFEHSIKPIVQNPLVTSRQRRLKLHHW